MAEDAVIETKLRVSKSKHPKLYERLINVKNENPRRVAAAVLEMTVLGDESQNLPNQVANAVIVKMRQLGWPSGVSNEQQMHNASADNALDDFEIE